MQFYLRLHQGNVFAAYVAFDEQSSSWWGAKEQGKRSVWHQGQQLPFSKAKEVQASIFSGAVSLSCCPDMVYWGDLAVMQGKMTPASPQTLYRRSFGMFEQNFCHEIHQLNHHLLPAAWASVSEAGLPKNLIRHIFPDDSNGLVISTGPPSLSHLGLVADNWQDHLKYVEAL